MKEAGSIRQCVGFMKKFHRAADKYDYWLGPPAFFLVVFGAAVGTAIFLMHFRHRPLAAVVEDRYWLGWTYVRYTDIEVVWDGDEHALDTETVTRCSDSIEGRELPPLHPPPPCVMHRGDRLEHSVQYVIRYHVQEERDQKFAYFMPSLWETLAPGAEVKIVRNVLGFVMEAETGGRHSGERRTGE